MSKKLKPLTIFLSDDELVNFKSHFDEFLNMNCDDKIKEQQQEIERLQEDLEYSNYCNEELRKKITNLKYKIKLLEEDNTGERALYHSEREVKEEYKDRIDKAIEYMQNIHWFDLRNNEGLQLYATDKNFWNELSNILKGSDKE